MVKNVFIHKEEAEVDGGSQATMLTEDTDQLLLILLILIITDQY